MNVIGKCKVKPPASSCSACIDTADTFGAMPDCNGCVFHTRIYNILQFTSGFLGTHAIIEYNGNVEKIPIDCITILKEEE